MMNMATNGMTSGAANGPWQNTQNSQMDLNKPNIENAPQTTEEQMKAAVVGSAGVQAEAGEWTCECGSKNNGKFCGNCGKAKPAQDKKQCPNCKAISDKNAKFCGECGTKLD